MNNNKEKLQDLNSCPLCGSNKFISMGKINYNKDQKFSGAKLGFDFHANLCGCRECFSKFVSPRIEESHARRLYSDSSATRWIRSINKEKDESDLNDIFQNYTPSGFREIFKKHIVGKFVERSNVLDIGCFNGELLDIFKFYNFKTFGVDLNRQAVSNSSERHEVIFGDISKAANFNEKFDIITIFDVIEHIYDMESFLDLVFHLLNKKGICLILTGNPNALGALLMRNKWWYFKYPEHVVFPSIKYFRLLKKKFGFEIESFYKCHHRSNYKLPITDHQLIILRKNSHGI